MERFLAGVRSEAPSAEYNRAAGIVTLRSWDDWILLEPVTFAITPENLDQACVVDAQTRTRSGRATTSPPPACDSCWSTWTG